MVWGINVVPQVVSELIYERVIYFVGFENLRRGKTGIKNVSDNVCSIVSLPASTKQIIKMRTVTSGGRSVRTDFDMRIRYLDISDQRFGLSYECES